MAYKQPSSGLPFKQLGSSPAKQKETIDFWNQPSKTKEVDLVKRTTDKLHSTEKSIGKSKEALNKSIKKVKGKTVNIKISDIKRQLKSASSKIKLSDVKKSLTKSMKLAGKVAKFVPGVLGLVLSATKTATADQPKFKPGDVHYQDPKKKIKFGD